MNFPRISRGIPREKRRGTTVECEIARLGLRCRPLALVLCGGGVELVGEAEGKLLQFVSGFEDVEVLKGERGEVEGAGEGRGRGGARLRVDLLA